jgi:hypothetical protein
MPDSMQRAPNSVDLLAPNDRVALALQKTLSRPASRSTRKGPPRGRKRWLVILIGDFFPGRSF